MEISMIFLSVAAYNYCNKFNFVFFFINSVINSKLLLTSTNDEHKISITLYFSINSLNVKHLNNIKKNPKTIAVFFSFDI